MEIAVGGRSLKSVRVCPLRNRKPEPTKTRFREAIFEGPTVRYPESLLHRELYYSSDKVGTLPQTLPLSASSSRCQTVYLSHDIRRSLSGTRGAVVASRSRKVRGLTDVWPRSCSRSVHTCYVSIERVHLKHAASRRSTRIELCRPTPAYPYTYTIPPNSSRSLPNPPSLSPRLNKNMSN